MAKITGFRIRYQEAGGAKLINCFNQDLGKGLHCGRKVCPPCDSNPQEKRQNCKSKNLIYESVCVECNPNVQPSLKEGSMSTSSPLEDNTIKKVTNRQRKGVYLGETSRSIHERTSEHLHDAKTMSSKSHIFKHWMLSHPGMNTLPAFRFRIVAQYRDCLSRQVGEAIKILYSQDHLLNSKSEYLNNCLTRISVPEEAWEKIQREIREGEEERLEGENMDRFRKLKSRLGECSKGMEEDGAAGSSTNVVSDDSGLLDISETFRGEVPGESSNEITKNENKNDLTRKSKPNIVVHHELNIARWWKWAEKVLPPTYSNLGLKTNHKKKTRRNNQHIAWWSIWWLRMEREAHQEKQDGAMLRFVKRQPTTDKPTPKLSVQDLVEVHKLRPKIGRLVMPGKITVDRTDFSNFVGTRKRELDDGILSPAKRVKNQVFSSSTHTLLKHSKPSNTIIFKLNKSHGYGDQLKEGKVIN